MSAEVDAAVAELLSGKPERRAQAHDTLFGLAQDPVNRDALVEKLTPLLTHAAADARGTAAVILTIAKGAPMLPELERLASDADPGVRSDVAHAASHLHANALLEKLLKDAVFEVRFEAATSLALGGVGAGLDILLEALERPAARFQALSALQKLGDERAREPVRRLFRRWFVSGYDRAGAAGVLARLGDEEARDWLLGRIGRRRGDERGLVIEIAGELRLLGATESLVGVLKDRADPFRGAAARALGMLGDERLRDLLVRTLRDEAEDPDTRMDAAEGLMHLGSPAARRALEEARDAVQDALVREVVVETLFELDKPSQP